MRKVAIALFIALLAVCAQAQQFGQNVLFTDSAPFTSVFPPMSAPYIRLWDSGTGLPYPGSAAYAKLVRTLNVLRPKGYKILFTIGAHHQAPITDAQYNSILGAVKTLGIESLEIWNEPNNKNDSPLSVTQACHYAALAHTGLAGTGIKVVGPASQGYGGIGYFGSFVQTCGASVDVFSHHMYNWTVNTPVVASGVSYPTIYAFNKAFAQKAAAFTGGKPLWVTEFNLIGLAAASVKGSLALSFMIDSARGLSDGGVSRQYFYSWDGTNMPISLMAPGRTTLTAEGQFWITAITQVNQGCTRTGVQ